MNTPFLARVREVFPAARVTVIGRRNVVPLFQPHPCVDGVIAVDDQSGSGFIAGVRAVRALRADVGFLLPNSLKTASFFAAAGIAVRIGYDRDARRFLLTHPVALRPEDLAVHEVQYYLRLLHFWQREALAPPPLRLEVTREERGRAAQWLAEHGIEPGDFVVGVNPAALYGTAKRWLPERYAETARHFVRERGAKVIVTGLPDERDVAREVCNAGGEAFHNGAGEMNLRELMAFLSHCNLYLTNDSGAMHIAAALGTPTVAVFGSTDWVTTAPLGSHTRIVRVDTPCAPCILRHCPIDHRCMTGVTPGMVVEGAEELLTEAAIAREGAGGTAG